MTATDTPGGAEQSAELAAHLVHRRVLDPPVRTEVLAGGVSNTVVAVTDGRRSVVCKQALGRLRVEEEWSAPVTRVLTEADALRAAADLTPGHVPDVLDVDPDRLTLTIERAPLGWRDWRTELLAGRRAEPWIGQTLGRLLARWHTSTGGGAGCSERVRDGQPAFEALRLDPFFETVAVRLPERGERIRAVAEDIRTRRECLVHGDFSPKNVLVGDRPGQLWVIDFEVAHLGDPTFDLSFLLSHLLLKAVHRPADAAAHQGVASAFLAGYRDQAVVAVDPLRCSDQVACLLLARVHGKSPAGYLSPSGRAQATATGLSLLQRPAPDLGGLFDRVRVDGVRTDRVRGGRL